MKKIILVYIVLVIAVILLAVVKAGGSFNFSLPFGKTSTAEVNGNKLNLIVAKSEKDRQKGLSGRKSLNQNQGMIFIFDHKDSYGFWMKDMLFPIDIIFIDDETVVYVVKKAPSSAQVPNLIIYKPDEPVNRVLEINAGLADKFKIEKGTKIKFKDL